MVFYCKNSEIVFPSFVSYEYGYICKLVFKVSKEETIRNRYNQVPHLIQGTTPESDKNTIKHHTKESQEVSPFLAGDYKAAMNRQERMTNTKHR